MSLRDVPPFRADHVGSLLRPPALLQAREDHAAGRIDAARLRAVEDEAIRDVVRMQEDVGCARRPTASSAARRGTWTSSTSSTESRKEAGHIAVQFHNPEGEIEFTPAALHVDGQARRLARRSSATTSRSCSGR